MMATDARTWSPSPDPGGGLSPTLTSVYDADGNLKASRDALNHSTTYSYDHLNRLTQVTQPNLDRTTYGYDAAGNRTSIKDGAGNTTTFQYDTRNRVKTETNQLSGPCPYRKLNAGKSELVQTVPSQFVFKNIFGQLDSKVLISTISAGDSPIGG